jgi:hypothetical protein
MIECFKQRKAMIGQRSAIQLALAATAADR